MMYTTRKLKLKSTPQLENLAHQAGIVYSAALVQFKRTLRKKDKWLSKNAIQKLIRNSELHSQTTQGITDILYSNLKSYRELKKTDPRARLPKRRRWYFAIPYKASALRLRDGKLILSNGRGNEPLVLDWPFAVPEFLTISYDNGYELNATYAIPDVPLVQAGTTAGVDLGEIHLGAVAFEDNSVVLINGRELRSKRCYQNKVKGKFQKRLSGLRKGSKKYEQVNAKKNKVLEKLDNQIRDILHKQSTALSSLISKNGVKTVAIGDVRDVRTNNDQGSYLNQKVHQMPTGRFREYLEYKCRRLGMETVLVNESWSSKTCPRCSARNVPESRNYVCSSCGFEGHRDAVGALNIRQREMYRGYVPVVGDMIPPVGVRYHAGPMKSVAKPRTS